MKFFVNTRRKIGYKKLIKSVENLSRRRAFNNFESASYVGIFFDSSKQQCYLAAKSLKEELESSTSCKVEMLGTVLNNEMLLYFPQTDGLTFHNQEEVDFWGLPKSKFIQDFIAKEFDILVNLNQNQDDLTVGYVCGLSKAKLKVGLNFELSFADFGVNASQEIDTEQLIQRIKNYLNALKPNRD